MHSILQAAITSIDETTPRVLRITAEPPANSERTTVNGIIFDMDGVLVDTEPIYVAMNLRLFEDLGIAITSEQHQTYVGISAFAMWKELKEQFALPYTVEALIEMEKKEQVADLEAQPAIPPIAGIPDLLADLRAHDPVLAVASSSSRRVVDLVLGRSGLRDLFPVTVSGDEVSAGKPDPEIFRRTAEALSIAPPQCLVIEDSPHGIAGARTLAMKTVGYQNPNSGTQDLSAADLVVHGFGPIERAQILELL